jgi:hypothetical protein
VMTEFGQLRSARSMGAKLRYLEDGFRNIDFLPAQET